MSKKEDESEKGVSEKTKAEEQDKGEEKKGEAPKSWKYQEMTLEDFNKLPHYVPIPPFPHRYGQPKRDAATDEILETFRKVEINIPLLDAIKQVPRYTRFLKELCTNKTKFKGNEKINVGENVSIVLQKKLPPKCKDPDMFYIPCKIGNSGFARCMLNLGAPINVMPRSAYDYLNLGPLEHTSLVIQLSDRSNAYLDGVLEDFLVQVNQLDFPADFYMLDMGGGENQPPILLGRPFLKASKTKTDVDIRQLTMEFDGEVIKFNIFDATDFLLTYIM